MPGSELRIYIIQDDSKFLPLGDSYTTDRKILNRHNKDLKIDKRGRDLLDFCIGHQLRILNGRILGDLFGNYTCYTPNECSTVDYTIFGSIAQLVRAPVW